MVQGIRIGVGDNTSIPQPVESNTELPTARDRSGVSLKLLCCQGAKPRNGLFHLLHALA